MGIEKDYRLLLENIAGLMVIDTDGNLVYMNERCADYIKADRKKSIGKYINDVFPPSTMTNLLKGNKQYNCNFYFVDGRMSVSSQIQLRKNGKIVGVLEYDLFEEMDELDEFLNMYTEELRNEVSYFREQVRSFRGTKYSIDNIIGSSQVMQDLRQQIEIAANSTSTVLVLGETGTGKELVAHSIHNLSTRAFNEFIKVNAAGMVETLIESELFGYVDGAFTGARKGGKKGKFELADQGTLFIDEIHQMPMSTQAKLLRALQEGEISPVGSEEDLSVNVRVIASSNMDLEKAVSRGEFRADLFYRLNVFPIVIPPLRERMEDIPELVRHHVEELNKEMGKSIERVDPSVFGMLMSYSWPGNIRELYNRVEGAMNYADGNTLRVEHFNVRKEAIHYDAKRLEEMDNPIEMTKQMAERNLIREVLARNGNNKTRAAEVLKISRPLLYQKMKRLGIEG